MKPLSVLGIGLSLFVAVVAGRTLGADEGMWPLNRFPTATLQERHGFTPSPQWLDQAQRGSVRFAGGCSGSFVSPGGLVMTNYHCVVQACVQPLSTAERNLLESGFYAESQAEERACPGMEINQLTSIQEVTERVAAATRDRSGEEFVSARKAVLATIERECATGADVRCDVVPLYRGARYDLYKYRRFQDVRLVFAPEFATGFFGGDPDNFMFPRYNLDLSFVRVYDNGAPLKPSHWFPWSPSGAAAGDLVFVTGHPGSTSRLDTVAQLEFDRDMRLPAELMFLAERRGVTTEFGRRGSDQARVAGAELVLLENSIKVSRHQLAALADPALLERKRAEESELRRQIGARADLQSRFGPAWDAIAAEVRRQREMYPRARAFSRLNSSDLFRHAQRLVQLAAEREKPNEQRLPEFTEAALPALRQQVQAQRPYSKDFETVKLALGLNRWREQIGVDDPAIAALLGRRSPDEVATAAIRDTRLDDSASREALMKGGAAAIAASTDPLIALARAADPFVRDLRRAVEQVDAVIDRNAELIAQARFATQGDRVYPDATFTLRVSYGTVKGWTENGREVTPFTRLRGLFDRHTGSAPYSLPPRWLERKAAVALDTPFNLSADTDIIGGNSGSPMLDRQGRIVGLVFDGNIHSIGGEYWFDAARNRTVAVDSRGIREALKSVYRADRLLDEISDK